MYYLPGCLLSRHFAGGAFLFATRSLRAPYHRRSNAMNAPHLSPFLNVHSPPLYFHCARRLIHWNDVSTYIQGQSRTCRSELKDSARFLRVVLLYGRGKMRVDCMRENPAATPVHGMPRKAPASCGGRVHKCGKSVTSTQCMYPTLVGIRAPIAA